MCICYSLFHTVLLLLSRLGGQVYAACLLTAMLDATMMLCMM